MKKLFPLMVLVSLSAVTLASNQEIIYSIQEKVKNELKKQSQNKETLCLNTAQAILLVDKQVTKDVLGMCGEFSSEITFSDTKVYSVAVCGRVEGKDIIGNPIESDYIYHRASKDFYFNYRGKKSFYYDPKSTKASIQDSNDSMFNAMQNRYCK